MRADPSGIKVADAIHRRRSSAQQLARLVEAPLAAREKEAAQPIGRLDEPLMRTEDCWTEIIDVDESAKLGELALKTTR